MSRRAKALILAIAALASLYFLYRVRAVLVPFYMGAAIAYLSHPIVKRIEAKTVPRSLAILLVYTLYAVCAVFLYYAILPSLTREIDQIVTHLPEQTRRAESLLGGLLDGLRRMWVPDGMREVATLSLQRVEALVERFAQRLAEILLGAVSHLFNLILAPFLAYYLLRDLARIRRGFISLLPGHVRREILELGSRVNRVVGGFVRGQLIVSAIVGVTTAGGLALLGVRYSLILGLFAGLSNIIPYFGPIIAAVPAVALALLTSPLTALWVAVLMIVIQQIEGTVISPKVVGERVGLHPLTVIFAVLAGGEMMGLVGMLIAVPVAATVKTVSAYIATKAME